MQSIRRRRHGAGIYQVELISQAGLSILYWFSQRECLHHHRNLDAESTLPRTTLGAKPRVVRTFFLASLHPLSSPLTPSVELFSLALSPSLAAGGE